MKCQNMTKLVIFLTILFVHASTAGNPQDGGLLGNILQGLSPVGDILGQTVNGFGAILDIDPVSKILFDLLKSVTRLVRPGVKTDTVLNTKFNYVYALHEACNQNFNATGAMNECFNSILLKFGKRLPATYEILAAMEANPNSCGYSATPIKREIIPSIYFDAMNQLLANQEKVVASVTITKVKNIFSKIVSLQGSCGSTAEMGEIAILMLNELSCMLS